MPEIGHEPKSLTRSHLLLDGLSRDTASLSASETLRHEIEAERELRARESVLSRSLTTVMGAFRGETALDRLRNVGDDPERIKAIVQGNKPQRLYEQDVADIGSAALKTGCLFLKGRFGTAATAVIYGLDSVKPGSSFGEMVVDGSLGMSKGLLNRKFLDWSHNQGWSIGKTGVMLGGFSRLTESSLSRQTYLDKDGQVDLGLGSRRIAETTFNPAAIAMDYTLFRFAGSAVNKLDARLGGKLVESPVLRNAATGGIFGMSTGFSGEALRQLRENDFDPKRLVSITLTRGLVDGVAAMPGGFQSQRMARFAAAENAKLAQPVSTETASINLSLTKANNALASMSETAAGRTGAQQLAAEGLLKTPEAQPKTLEHSTAKTGTEASKATDTTNGAKLEASATKVQEAPRSNNPASAEALRSVRAEMGAPEEVQETHYKLKPESERVNEEDYQTWRNLNLEPAGKRPMEVYSYKGLEIAVPKDYNETLSQLRQWRAENPGQEIPETHPLYQFRDRALPEDIAAALDNAVPNPAEIRRVNLLNEESVSDAYLAQRSPGHQSAAEANPEREVNFYKPKLNAFLENDILHEWSHIAKWSNTELSYLFDQAAKVEASGQQWNDYAKVSLDENFAVHASEAMAGKIEHAREFADKAPVRAAIILKMFKDALDAHPPNSPRMAQLRGNVDTLYKPTLEQARKALVSTINESSNNQTVESAAKTLLILGEESDFAAITKPIAKLDFTGEPIHTEHLDKLRLFKHGVASLNLTSTMTSDVNIGSISKLPTLAELTLSRTTVTNWGLGELARGNRIGNLDLSHTLVDGRGIPHLRTINPEKLNLTGTRFTAEELERLKQSLKDTKISH